jgi:flagellar export protein FliJ
MSGLAILIKLAERRAEEAVTGWARLTAQRDDAKHKLVLLEKHGEGYRDLMRTGLHDGVSAASLAAQIGFIGQIESIVVRQQSELGQLEEACARQWQELLSARRAKRMYEILSERSATREAANASRRQHAEIAEKLQRAASSPPISRHPRSDE